MNMMKKTLRMFREEGYEDGERNGKIQATIEMCLNLTLFRCHCSKTNDEISVF